MRGEGEGFDPRSNLAAAALLHRRSEACAAAAVLIGLAEKQLCAFRLDTTGRLFIKRLPVPPTVSQADPELDMLRLMVPEKAKQERPINTVDFTIAAGRLQSVRTTLFETGYLKNKSRRVAHIAAVGIALAIFFGMGLGIAGQVNPTWCVIAIATVIGCTCLASVGGDEVPTPTGEALAADWLHTASLAHRNGTVDLCAIVACYDVGRLELTLTSSQPWLEHPDDMSPTDAFKATVKKLVEAYN